MKRFILIATTAVLLTGAAGLGAQAATVTCAETGKQVQSALKTAKLTAAEKTTVETKIKKASADCKAKKEADANMEYETVLQMLKK